jgi:hypothetical protein
MRNVERGLLFLVFLSLALFFYWPTKNARFVFDFIDWYNTYTKFGAEGLLHSFYGPSLHHLYHLVDFILLKTFELNATAWLFFFCSLHSVNTLLVYVLAQRILNSEKIFTALVALLFLLSPHQTEVVVWGATVHYLVVVFLALSILFLIMLPSLLTRKRTVAIHLLFAAGLFTHEIMVVMPAIISVLLWFKPTNMHSNSSRKFWTQIVLPQFAIIACYLLLNKILLHKWVGHYGAETHLQVNVLSMFAMFNKYLLKFFALGTMFPYSKQQILYAFGSDVRVLASMLVLFVLFWVAQWHFKGNPTAQKLKTIVMCTLCFGIAVFPVLNLYFPDVVRIHGDRLGYLASAFAYLMLGAFFMLLNQKIAVFLMSSFLVLNIHFLIQNNSSWNSASRIVASLNQEFDTTESGNIYILNLPDNFNGAYMYRCLGKSKFAETYHVQTGKILSQNIYDVAAYNLQSETDSVVVTVVDSTTLKVELSHWGNWFWNTAGGPLNYENETLKTVFDEYGHSYIVTFKNRKPADVVLYQAGMHWQIVNNF